MGADCFGKSKGIKLETALSTQDRVSKVDRMQMEGVEKTIHCGSMNTQEAEDGVSRLIDNTREAEDDDVDMMREIGKGCGKLRGEGNVHVHVHGTG